MKAAQFDLLTPPAFIERLLVIFKDAEKEVAK